ncbi:MAG: MoaD/ThiS family protein [Planctomycetes bacterium]|nr:MoaD/ThiS family protein [Planctomycetota bacterium]MCC7172209.1 MoaD/ThiS family protein [Planctomycetota bacterium]
MNVRVPSPLISYTGSRTQVEAEGATLAAVLDDLERRHSGIRFRMIDEQDRIRPHIKLFVGGRLARSLAEPVAATDEVMIVAALSGG